MNAMKSTDFAKSFDGNTIYYEEIRPASKPLYSLLFVHGWGCDRSFWSGQTEYFSKIAQVISLDLAGHGLSSSTRTQWSLEAFAQDVISVIQKIDSSNIIIVGHSLAGEIAIEVAAHVKDRILGGVAVDALDDPYASVPENVIQDNVDRMKADFIGFIDRFVENTFLETRNEDLVTEIKNKMKNVKPEVGICAWEEMLKYVNRRYPAVFSDCSIPLLVINSERRQAKEQEFIELINDVRFRYIPDAGHFLMLEKPDIFNYELETFIRHLVTL